VAVNGIPHGLPEFVPGIGFGKDGMTQSASNVSTFGSLFYQEQYLFGHPAVSLLLKLTSDLSHYTLVLLSGQP
jgi:hypothetical protein